MKRYFPYLIFIAAFLVSGSAAYYSVFGMSKLFSGHKTEAFILFSSLEFAKLIIAASLHQYWKELNKGLRVYLCIATGVLIIFTSGGIYGFLSDAYQQTADKDRFVQTRIELLKKKQSYFQTQLEDSKTEKSTLTNSIQDLRKSLSTDNQYQSIDRRTGQILTQIQSTSKKGIQSQLDNAVSKNDNLDIKIQRLQDSISSFDLRIIETEQNSDVASELGPLKYLSNLTGKPMDQIVNWFLVLLMFVFDPLAIALVLTSLFAFAQIKEKEVEIQPDKELNKAREYHSPIIEEFMNLGTEEELKKTKDEMISTLSDEERKELGLEKPKRKYKSRKKHFDNLLENPILSEDENLLESEPTKEELPKRSRKRKIVDTNLTPDIGKHLSDSLNKKKVN